MLPICNDRAAVVTVLDRFRPLDSTPASQARLVRMRARGSPPTGLATDPRWRDAVVRINALSSPPPLVLTEEP
jgi:hypothetical protein